ncbi:hypothetical protein [Candidatus Xianfuyuplasma coldseepsis]|uniref:DUF4430 domain-containing protein n=1 Tax=Candidatus Xianfuyuplasma coldseepsis TaxID=2782163 RepID=A0A7L7KTW5_9MOLU|nr:hypothetical protein [Xianfuyuplasma coldseepsis]QMS85444.1 hypothetical protein G4Z02_06640 [Xianfuyuplasma coldseepsis]
MKKIMFTIIAIGVAVSAFFIQDYLRQNDELGTITIVLINELEETTTTEIEFTEDDDLLSLMRVHFDLECADMNYQKTTCENARMGGNILLRIDQLDTDWTNNYIGIYVDNQYSNYGIDDILLIDGATYTFEYTEVGEE